MLTTLKNHRNQVAVEQGDRFRHLFAQRIANGRCDADLVEQVLRDSAVAERLLLGADSERALTNLRHLGELLVRAAGERHGDLALLIRQLRRWQQGLDFPPGENGDEQRLEGRADAVQILTLHAAKGLEAPVVVVFAPKAGRISSLHRFHDDGDRRCLYLGKAPEGSSTEARIEAEAAQEQERLMYVALTRAKARLVVPCFIVEATSKARAGEPEHPKGPLKVLNRVLRSLLEGGGEALQLAIALRDFQDPEAASEPAAFSAVPADVEPWMAERLGACLLGLLVRADGQRPTKAF